MGGGAFYTVLLGGLRLIKCWGGGKVTSYKVLGGGGGVGRITS